MKPVVLSLSLLTVALIAAPAKRTFTGTITDSMCAKGDHSQMQMGPTDAECAIACVQEHSAEFVLYTGREVYVLSDQKTAEKFAAQRVRVTGRLDAKSGKLAVESILPVK